MSRRPERKPEPKQGVPSWVVSFTDMITLLLSFFIMLQAFASAPSPELFHKGRAGFNRAVAGLGIPQWLLGNRKQLNLEAYRPKYPIEEDRSNRRIQRIPNIREEAMKAAFARLASETDVEASDYQPTAVRPEPTPVRFARGGADLDAAGRAHLAAFAADVRTRAARGPLDVYVLGLAPDETVPKHQWMAAARRAEAARGHLAEALADLVRAGRVNLLAWGEGPGPRDAAADPVHLRLAVVELNERK